MEEFASLLQPNVSPEIFRAMFLQGNFQLIENLIGGLSHDMKQPLNVTKILVQSLLRDISKGRLNNETLQQSLKNVVMQVDSLAESLDKLRAFFCAKNSRKVGNDSVRQVIEDCLDIFVTQYANHGIVLECLQDDKLAAFAAKGEEFKMMLVALMATAKSWLDLMHEGGRGVTLNAALFGPLDEASPQLLLTLAINHTGEVSKENGEANKGAEAVFTADDMVGVWLAREILKGQDGAMMLSHPQEGRWIIEVKFPLKSLR